MNGIEKLYLKNNVVYAKSDQNYSVFNLNNESLKSNLTESQFLKENGKLEELKDPHEFHKSHWGWKILFF